MIFPSIVLQNHASDKISGTIYQDCLRKYQRFGIISKSPFSQKLVSNMQCNTWLGHDWGHPYTGYIELQGDPRELTKSMSRPKSIIGT